MVCDNHDQTNQNRLNYHVNNNVNNDLDRNIRKKGIMATIRHEITLIMAKNSRKMMWFIIATIK